MTPDYYESLCHICLEEIGNSSHRPFTNGVSKKFEFLTDGSKLPTLLFSNKPKIHCSCKGKLESLAKKKARAEGHKWDFEKKVAFRGHHRLQH